MEVSRKNIYLSFPYTGHEELAKHISKKYKEILMRAGADSVWSPVDNIDESKTWDEAMDECMNVMRSRKIDCVIVLNVIDTDCSSITNQSRGVAAEITEAMELGLPLEIIPIKLSNTMPRKHKIWVSIGERFRKFTDIFNKTSK